MPNEFFGWNRGANKVAADTALQNDGQIELTWRQKLHGAKEEDVQNILNRKLQKENDLKYGAAAIEAGLTPFAGGSLSNFGESSQKFAARIKAAKTKKEAAELERLRGIKKEDDATAQTNALEILSKKNEHSNSQFTTQLESQRLDNQANREQQNAQYAHTSEQNALTRRHENERADKRETLSLQMQVMQNDLAEKRMDYDRETARMDKRSQAIAQLMSGLGSLGGAFSL